MKLGISSFTYAWAIGIPGQVPEYRMTAVDLLSRAAELGVQLVQVADNLPIDQLSSAELAAFEERAAHLNIGVELGTRGIGLGHLRNYLRLAKRLSSPILRVVIDTADHHPAEDEIIDTIKAIAPQFERARVCLAIENHDRFRAETLTKLLRQIDSEYVGICLDTVNSFGALEGPEVVVKTLGPWAVNLHVKDFAIFRPRHHGGFTIEGRPVGQGRLDVPWLLQELRAYGRDPNAILEQWPPRGETLADTIATERAWAAESVEYLRQFIPQ